MKVLLGIAIACAVLWTAFVVFANMVKPAGTVGFVGGNTLVVVWLVVGVLGSALVWG
jgi:hypothetical protein